MLDDGAGGRAPGIELGDAFVGRVGIIDIVVGELLALHLAGAGNAGARSAALANPLARAFEQGGLAAFLAFLGIFGTGLALGSPQRIPAVTTDFIFAAVGEELGLLGTCAIVVAFLLMVGSGLRIALRAEAPFEKLLATGLTTIIGVQAFIIIGGITRLVPLTGITLPFVSYGGSSLLANYVLLALLLRVSDGDTTRTAAFDQVP